MATSYHDSFTPSVSRSFTGFTISNDAQPLEQRPGSNRFLLQIALESGEIYYLETIIRPVEDKFHVTQCLTTVSDTPIEPISQERMILNGGIIKFTASLPGTTSKGTKKAIRLFSLYEDGYLGIETGELWEYE